MIEGEGPDFPLPFLLNGGKKYGKSHTDYK